MGWEGAEVCCGRVELGKEVRARESDCELGSGDSDRQGLGEGKSAHSKCCPQNEVALPYPTLPGRPGSSSGTLFFTQCFSVWVPGAPMATAWVTQS